MENLISFGNALLIYLSIGCIYVILNSKKIDKALAEANKESVFINTESEYFKFIMYVVTFILWLPIVLYKPKF